MGSREKMMAAQDEASEKIKQIAVAVKEPVAEAKWDNGAYDPHLEIGGKIGAAHDRTIAGGLHFPMVGDWVQMVIENRDSPEPEVRPFLIVQVLDASIGLVNGMLFMANSDIRQGEAGIFGGGMSQAIRQAGFVVPESVKGVFWLDRVRFHPKGLPRQQSREVEKLTHQCYCNHYADEHEQANQAKCIVCECDDFAPQSAMAQEPLWESLGVPLLEATWRWPQ